MTVVEERWQRCVSSNWWSVLNTRPAELAQRKVKGAWLQLNKDVCRELVSQTTVSVTLLAVRQRGLRPQRRAALRCRDEPCRLMAADCGGISRIHCESAEGNITRCADW